ncbi:MAG: tetratricopeptide repeat protein [Isosphaeraceae bacterium]
MNPEMPPIMQLSATPRSKRIVAGLRLLAIAVPIAVLATAATVLPGWIPVLPRAVRRGIVEAALRGVLIGYSGLVLAALIGTPMMVWLASRSRRQGRIRPAILRGFAACLVCLVSLVVLEVGSAAWRGWMHRFPALPTTFEASTTEEYRIVVLGGSSALGEPYRPWLSVGQIVAWQLQRAVPKRRFDCEILAWLGDSLEKQHHKLAGLKHRPDAVIIYSGHNEFAARFEEERDSWDVEEPGDRILRGVYQITLVSPFCRLAYEMISKNRLDSPPLTGRHQLIDPPLCSPSESADILADFRGRLEAIVGYCDRIRALPILIVPPANEAGYEPSRSTLPASVPMAERRRLVVEFERARAEELSEPALAAAGYAAILARHPGFAEAHFRLARLLERAGDPAEAGRHYLAALDLDGLPIRCPAPFRAAYEEVARRHPRSILIDGRRELAAVSPNGLIGDRVIQDTHHPTLLGYLALAGAVIRELQARTTFPDAQPVAIPIDPADCIRHFSLDSDKWAIMCDRTRVHYQRVAGYRYDPTERLEKSRNYAEAALRIRDGKDWSLVIGH